MVPTSLPDLPKPSRTPGKSQNQRFRTRTIKQILKFLLFCLGPYRGGTFSSVYRMSGEEGSGALELEFSIVTHVGCGRSLGAGPGLGMQPTRAPGPSPGGSKCVPAKARATRHSRVAPRSSPEPPQAIQKPPRTNPNPFKSTPDRPERPQEPPTASQDWSKSPEQPP